MEATLRRRPSPTSYWDRAVVFVPFLILFVYIAPLLYYILLFGSYYGSAVTLELQKSFWISQGTSSLVVIPLREFAATFFTIVFLPIWVLLVGWIPGCPRCSVSPRRWATDRLTGRLEKIAITKAQGLASGVDETRSLLAFSSMSYVGGVMVRKVLIQHDQILQLSRRQLSSVVDRGTEAFEATERQLQEVIARDFLVTRFRIAGALELGTRSQVIATLQTHVRDEILQLSSVMGTEIEASRQAASIGVAGDANERRERDATTVVVADVEAQGTDDGRGDAQAAGSDAQTATTPGAPTATTMTRQDSGTSEVRRADVDGATNAYDIDGAL
jgi:hypothetical protein